MKILTIVVLLMFSVSADKKDALFIGDSLTTYRGGWQDVISKAKNYNYQNLSIGGKRTDWMVNVLCNNLTTKHQYDTVFIYGGINDIFTYYKASVPLTNVKRMIEHCIKYNVTPIIITGYDPSIITNTWVKTYYANGKSLEDSFRKEYKIYQDSLMCLKNITVIPPIRLLRSDSDDGIHLNASGHKKFSEWILKHL